MAEGPGDLAEARALTNPLRERRPRVLHVRPGRADGPVVRSSKLSPGPIERRDRIYRNHAAAGADSFKGDRSAFDRQNARTKRFELVNLRTSFGALTEWTGESAVVKS